MPARFSSLPDEAELQRACEAADRATNKLAAERKQMNFGKSIASAVKRRTAIVASSTAVRRKAASASATRSAARAEGNGFGAKVAAIVTARTRKQHEEQAEKERSRYKFKPRKRTKSE